MYIKDIIRYLDEIGIDFEFKGKFDDKIDGFSSLKNYRKDTITWIKSERNQEELEAIQLAIVSVDTQNTELIKNIIRTDESKRAFFSILEKFYGDKKDGPMIGDNTYISNDVLLGENVRIGHNCVLDGKIKIGDNTIIWNNVTIINKCEIGPNTEVQSGTVIGHDGFGYSVAPSGEKIMIKHYGGVVIGENTNIGCNVVINRGTIDDTIIEKNTKIDAQNFIAHNVHIRENCSLIVGNRIYGSADIGSNAYLATSIIKNQVKLGEGCTVGMGSVVTHDVDPKATVVGVPAKTRK